MQGGFLPRRRGDTATAVCNRRGPQRLELKPPWATTNGCQNCKILKPSYNFEK
jgi:hypothetical protein